MNFQQIIKLNNIAAYGVGGLPPPPSGFGYLVDRFGAYLVDRFGNYLIGRL